jgi:hypothetical protein
MHRLIIVSAISALILGCERNASVSVGPSPVLLSTSPETSLTSMGTLNATPQNVREAILAVAKDLNLAVLTAPPAGIEGEAIFAAPSGPAVRVHYREIEPNNVEVTVRRDNVGLENQIDSLTRRMFDEIRRRALSNDPTGPKQ